MKLAVLDLQRSTGQTVALAPEVEQLGYSRFWITEHQPQPSPILFTTLVAAITESMRVGTAGILMRYYAPPRAAYDFQLLEKAFPGRIDAGICAGFIPPHFEDAFMTGREKDEDSHELYMRKSALFCQYVRSSDSRDSWGDQESIPEVWILGGGPRIAAQAALEGTAFGYSLFFQHSRDDPYSVDLYRDQFHAKGDRTEPLAVPAVAGICAASDEEAERLRAEHRNEAIVPLIVGSPDRCADALRDLAGRYQSDEVAFMDLCRDLDDRIRCYELLAGALDLERPAATA